MFCGREMGQQAHDITQLLQSWSQGDKDAMEKLIPLVYEDLHRRAQHYMSDERPGHALQTTALVNEAYLRLVDSRQVSWESRSHFYAVCAQVMRRILVDWARSRRALKRGNDIPLVEFKEEAVGQLSTDFPAIDDALQALAALDPRKSQIVELRFFGGLSVQETADVLKVSTETVQRDWKLAKSWLKRELTRENSGGN
jgi:RNA polymerase sigma factor (TIGR02999 family)